MIGPGFAFTSCLARWSLAAQGASARHGLWLFNLVSGVALVIASLVAGLLWDSLGAPATFLTGATFSAAALVLLFKRGGNLPTARGA